MTIILEQSLLELFRELPSELQVEVRDFAAFLLQKRARADIAATAAASGWPPGFFEQTAGSIPDFPDIDGDMSGLDPSLDANEEELRFDLLAEPEKQNTAV